MDYQKYIKPELLVLIPVLYLIGEGIKKTSISSSNIPWILGVTGILLSMVYIVATEPLDSTQAIANALFSAITQGILIAGASVYANQLIKQSQKEE